MRFTRRVKSGDGIGSGRTREEGRARLSIGENSVGSGGKFGEAGGRGVEFGKGEFGEV